MIKIFYYAPNQIDNKWAPTTIIGTVKKSETLIDHMISDLDIIEVEVGDVTSPHIIFALIGFFIKK